MGTNEPASQTQIHFCFVCHGPGTTRHHLVPKKTRPEQRGNKFFWRETVRACQECHDDIHYYFSLWELAVKFNTEEKLKAELKRRKSNETI